MTLVKVRREERKHLRGFERKMNKQRTLESLERENAQRIALHAATAKLRDGLGDISRDWKTYNGRDGSPCSEERQATINCYHMHGKENPGRCTTVVDRFAECARRLQF